MNATKPPEAWIFRSMRTSPVSSKVSYGPISSLFVTDRPVRLKRCKANLKNTIDNGMHATCDAMLSFITIQERVIPPRLCSIRRMGMTWRKLAELTNSVRCVFVCVKSLKCSQPAAIRNGTKWLEDTRSYNKEAYAALRSYFHKGSQ
jgi:hypothetical protein